MNHFCKCFRNHSTKDPYSGKIESVNTDGTFHENTTRRKSVSKEDLLHNDFKGSSSPGQIEYNQKTYGKLQVTLLFSVQIQLYMDKHICSVLFGNDAQYTLLVVNG